MCLICRRSLLPLVQQHSFLEIGHEMISMAILPLLLIQAGQLSVTSERMCKKVLVKRLGLSLPRKSVVRLIDRLDMTIAIDWDVKPQNKNSNVLHQVDAISGLKFSDDREIQSFFRKERVKSHIQEMFATRHARVFPCVHSCRLVTS